MRRKWQAILRWIVEHPDRDIRVVCAHEAPCLGTPSTPVVRLSNCVVDRPLADLAELLWCGAKSIQVSCSAFSCGSAAAVLPRIESSPLPEAGVAGYVLDEAAPPVPRQVLWLRGASTALPVVEGTDQERLVAALAGLGLAPLGNSKAELLTVSGCVACGVCVRSCRNGALALEQVGAVSRLVFSPALCTGARGCVMFCPQHVMRSSRSMTLAELAAAPVVVLAETETVECVTCRTRFPAADANPECRVCRVSPLHG